MLCDQVVKQNVPVCLVTIRKHIDGSKEQQGSSDDACSMLLKIWRWCHEWTSSCCQQKGYACNEGRIEHLCALLHKGHKARNRGRSLFHLTLSCISQTFTMPMTTHASPHRKETCSSKPLPAHHCGCICIAPDGQPPVLEAVEGALCDRKQQHEYGQDVEGSPCPCVYPVCLCVNLANISALHLCIRVCICV